MLPAMDHIMACLAQVRLKAIQCMDALVRNLANQQAKSGPAASLGDPNKAPLLAFLFSSLISAAEGEVQAGLKGSKGLSAVALRALNGLIQAVGNGNALAFVLPGLASSLAKILLAAGEDAAFNAVTASAAVSCGK